MDDLNDGHLPAFVASDGFWAKRVVDHTPHYAVSGPGWQDEPTAPIHDLFNFVGLPRHRKVGHVEPREDPGQNCPQNRFITLPKKRRR
jgi:hypothetical protein